MSGGTAGVATSRLPWHGHAARRRVYGGDLVFAAIAPAGQIVACLGWRAATELCQSGRAPGNAPPTGADRPGHALGTVGDDAGAEIAAFPADARAPCSCTREGME